MIKLIKHEWLQMWNYLSLILIAGTLFIISQRILLINPIKNIPVLGFLANFAPALLFMSIAAFVIVVFLFLIIRFFKSMFGDEGYLTFTLPVEPWKIILSKTLVASVYYFITLFIITMIIMSIEPRLLEQVLFLMDHVLYSSITKLVLVLPILYPISTLMSAYLAMSLGQISNKNKVVMSIVFYIIIGMVSQVVGSIITLIFFKNDIEILSSTRIPTEAMMIDFFNTFTLSVVILALVTTVAEFFLIQLICKKKLNLQ